jgi:hypothetical protein
MPASYRYFGVPNLPAFRVGQKVTSETQLAMPWGDETAHTTMTYLGVAAATEFERYYVEHQVDRDIDAIYNHEPVKRLIEVRRFPAFYHREAQYFLVRAEKRDARSMFERLSKISPPISAKSEEVDLQKLQELGRTTGGWFGNLKIADVRTAGIFGSATVVASEEWGRYSDLGEISALYMHVAGHEDSMRPIMITRERGVVLMKESDERLDLGFIAHIQATIDGTLA